MINYKKTPYKAVVFDMDGTLLNTLPDLAEAGNHTLTELGFKQHSLQDYKYFVGNGLSMLIKRIMPVESTETEFKKALDIFTAYYVKNMFKNTTTYPGVLELIKKLNVSGIKTGIITNKPHQPACELAKHYFPDLIQITLGARDGVLKKPAPDTLLEIADLLNVKTNKILYVGDSGVDMQTAKNAGVKSCGVLWGFRERQELIENGADFLAKSTEELGSIIFNKI